MSAAELRVAMNSEPDDLARELVQVRAAARQLARELAWRMRYGADSKFAAQEEAAAGEESALDAWDERASKALAEAEEAGIRGAEAAVEERAAAPGIPLPLQAVVNASSRVLVGLAGESAPDCDWYDGILDDAQDELRRALAAVGQGAE